MLCYLGLMPLLTTQFYEAYDHGSNPGQDELGVCSASALSRTSIKNKNLFGNAIVAYLALLHLFTGLLHEQIQLRHIV